MANTWGGDSRDPYKYAGKNTSGKPPFLKMTGGLITQKPAEYGGGSEPKNGPLRPDHDGATKKG